MPPRDRAKKILRISARAFTWLFAVFAVLMLFFTVFTATTVDKIDRSFFGMRVYVVKSGSMSATDFDAGDVIFSKNVDPEALKEGDVITFLSQDPDSFGEIVTHKIRRVTTDEYGRECFVTYGTTTNTDDETVVPHECVLGKYQGRIPRLGSFLLFLKTTPGYIFFVLIPFLLLIFFEAAQSIRLYGQYKKEEALEQQEKRENEKSDES